jgi:hypothetical protein
LTFRPTIKEWIKECHQSSKQNEKRRDEFTISGLGDKLGRAASSGAPSAKEDLKNPPGATQKSGEKMQLP